MKVVNLCPLSPVRYPRRHGPEQSYRVVPSLARALTRVKRALRASTTGPRAREHEGTPQLVPLWRRHLGSYAHYRVFDLVVAVVGSDGCSSCPSQAHRSIYLSFDTRVRQSKPIRDG